MATQVEALPADRPLVRAPEHGHGGGTVLSADRPRAPEHGHAGSTLHGEGANEPPTGGAGEAGSSTKTDDPQRDISNQERPSKKAPEEDSPGKEHLDPMASPVHPEESVKGTPKEYTEAPPPKVNPWTRKMNAVTVVNVNGQAHGLANGQLPFTVNWCCPIGSTVGGCCNGTVCRESSCSQQLSATLMPYADEWLTAGRLIALP
ncbi:hypothetical protein NHX12_034257 [Muraenolepis orangiensis]|uniref:Uncharacterized protein n=1 Tax=Muraenolepis orangiensis TaxID=630683 RepID=A0A9Q0D4E2_9TELE|nr:hypothetical protein NHX12_034257 [Muraenolepis orangiensis]